MLHRWTHSYLGPDVDKLEVYQQRLFQYAKEIYDTGARNFLFIEVPPMERAPGRESIVPMKEHPHL